MHSPGVTSVDDDGVNDDVGGDVGSVLFVMKLKNTFTPPTTGPLQLAEVVLVADALQ